MDHSQDGSLCVSGGRDHQLKVWKIDSDELVLHKRFNKSHSAWIWSIEQLDRSTLVSGSFDQTVKTWDMETETLLDSVMYPAAVLSLAQNNRLVACGTMDSKIHLQDHRAKSETKCFGYHKNIVLSLAMDEKVGWTGVIFRGKSTQRYFLLSDSDHEHYRCIPDDNLR